MRTSSAKPAALFQHTVARRRLVYGYDRISVTVFVSTHSRLKAAGSRITRVPMRVKSFNTQPPEGGWLNAIAFRASLQRFQHTAA